MLIRRGTWRARASLLMISSFCIFTFVIYTSTWNGRLNPPLGSSSVLSSSQHSPSMMAVVADGDRQGQGLHHHPCPQPPQSDYERNTMKRVIVAAHHNEDVAWLNGLSHVCPIIIMGPGGMPKNKAKEGVPYLTYIIQNYEHLPESMLFMHAHSASWHTTGPQLYQIEAVDCWEDIKYASLTLLPRTDPVYLRAEAISPADRKDAVLDDMEKALVDFFTTDPNLSSLLGLPMPDSLLSPCCATFIVHRKTILARPKHVYEALLEWVLRQSLTDAVSSRVLEHVWHLIFGDPPHHIFDWPAHEKACAAKKKGSRRQQQPQEASAAGVGGGGGLMPATQINV